MKIYILVRSNINLPMDIQNNFTMLSYANEAKGRYGTVQYQISLYMLYYIQSKVILVTLFPYGTYF